MIMGKYGNASKLCEITGNLEGKQTYARIIKRPARRAP
jgi:hypothetical protein